jgi:predicted transcriptional regulator
MYFAYENSRVMNTQKQIKPTESELEILGILWNKGKATVREVHETMASHKDVGYTTTLKLMQIMNEKGMVIRDDKHRTHVYTPTVNKQATQQQFLGKIVNTLFGGSSAQLVMHALGNHQPNEQEIEQIEQLLKSLKK